MATPKSTAAVLGAGLIGTDLVVKIQASAALNCGLVVGRDRHCLGLRRAAEMGCATSAGGIDALLDAGPFDVVFDASNADAHAEHWKRLWPTGATLINLTPTRTGAMIVPTVNAGQAREHRHINLVSCGGQAAIPILHALAAHHPPAYVEVVSTAASPSAGRATRLNLDHYIATTGAAVRSFTTVTGCPEPTVKLLVNLSPARPEPSFRVTMTMLAPSLQGEPVLDIVEDAAEQVRAYCPGYAVTSVAVDGDRISVTVQVTATGGRLPRYAGNLDIINAAAVLLAQHIDRADMMKAS